MKKRILVLLALIMSVLFVSCGSSGDNVKDALNDTSIFSQEEINYVNSLIEDDHDVTLKTINSTTMQFSGNYSYGDGNGNTVSATFSEKIEKKNGIVVHTSTDSNSSNPSVYYELTIPRVFGDYKDNEFFTEEQRKGLKQLLSDNGLSEFSIGSSNIGSNINAFSISLDSYPDCSYKGNIVKCDNKYYLFDNTGITASENTLEELIKNTSVKSKLQKELNIVLAGTYRGTYSGGDNGTWNITINSNGSITGTTTSHNYGGTYSVNGTLNGNIATLTATSGSVLTATVSSNGINGNWTNSNLGISGSLTEDKD